eukprot:TRINITY_DN43373_c0_g1_i1.p1 TRINITY_DN43373_c0_g1~~TRINITY_DN43373_c0_g1_i1.p1  ORF type:complete len:466 (+),score=141.56 TRINITY_DN43373_c0_g1_i1:62-1399(+)
MTDTGNMRRRSSHPSRAVPSGVSTPPPHLCRRKTLAGRMVDELTTGIEWDSPQLPEVPMRRSRTCPDFGCDEVTSSSEEESVPPPVQAAGGSELLVWVLLFLLCGCGCLAFVELLNNYDKGCGEMVSAVEYSLGFVVHGKNSLSKKHRSRIPLTSCVLMGGCAVAYSQFSNMAMASSVPMSLFLVIKSSSLVAQLAVGALFGNRYNWQQLVSCAVVTVGAVVATLSTTAVAAPPVPEVRVPGSPAAQPANPGGSIMFGVTCLILALLCRALGNEVESQAYSRYKVSKTDILFLRAACGAPYFLLDWRGILQRTTRWNTDSTVLSVAGVPVVWLYLAGNCVLDYFCKVVYARLCRAAGALVATVALSMQRCASLVISAVYLNRSAPTAQLFVGAGIVIGGSFAVVVTTARQQSCLGPRDDGGACKDAPPPVARTPRVAPLTAPARP